MEKEIMVITNDRIWGKGEDINEASEEAKKQGASKGDKCVVLKVPKGTTVDEMGHLVYKNETAYKEGKKVLLDDGKII